MSWACDRALVCVPVLLLAWGICCRNPLYTQDCVQRLPSTCVACNTDTKIPAASHMATKGQRNTEETEDKCNAEKKCLFFNARLF